MKLFNVQQLIIEQIERLVDEKNQDCRLSYDRFGDHVTSLKWRNVKWKGLRVYSLEMIERESQKRVNSKTRKENPQSVLTNLHKNRQITREKILRRNLSSNYVDIYVQNVCDHSFGDSCMEVSLNVFTLLLW